MSQQHDYTTHSHLPPPSPSPRSRTGGTSSAAGHTFTSTFIPGPPVAAHAHAPDQRSRPVSTHLPSITTTFLNAPASYSSSQASTPISGAHLTPGGHLPYSPAPPSALGPKAAAFPPPPPGASPSPRTPVIMEPYNPRQWPNRGQVSGSQMVFQQRQSSMPAGTTQVTGMEAAMPSPPPPYSPGTPDNAARTMTSPMLENTGFVASPLAESSSRNSPQVPMSPAFPPPPAQSSRHRDRSASGLAGNKGFFSLSGLRGKQPAEPDRQQPHMASPAQTSPFVDARPPAARRAASTGHIQSGGPAPLSVAGPVGRESPESSWHPGMPLPGPPPGPPPPGARSQSLNRPLGVSNSGNATPEPAIEPPRRRTAAAPTLGPVPPTPANWTEQTDSQDQQPLLPTSAAPDAESQPLRIDTGSTRDAALARRPAQRDTSAQGIRERRSRSRQANGTFDDSPGPSNLVFSPGAGSISRRRDHARTNSGYAEPSSAPSPLPSQVRTKKIPGNIMTPPYTPAVGKQPLGSAGKQPVKVPGSASSDRPISHLLHTPNDGSATMPAPLSPSRPVHTTSARASPKLDNFSLQAIERHRAFIEKEMAAATDEERLELFANFIVHESRLRRDRYPIAYNSMAGEILDLTRDMWRSYNSRSSRRAITPSTSMSSIDPTIPSWASDGQPTSAHGNIPSSASSLGDFTPATDTGSASDFGEGFERAEGRQWAETFKPSLSPIPSMAVSTVPDEDSSRGRTASRWWEQSRSGGGSIGKPDRMEKSRRETKYMGVNPAALQANDQDPRQTNSPGPDQPYMYGPDEYPAEKVGWHEGNDFDTPMATPHRQDERKGSTPGMGPLDVSRLVTLPPPYPRHHPAVNNSHPLLSDLRSDHRLLADHSEIQTIKDSYLEQDFTLSREQQEAVKQRRAKLRKDIQTQIADGSMSFADAAKAEADFDVEEAERGKATARSNFDVFEASVSHPMNTLLTERLDRANTSIKRLRAELENVQETSNPNQAQEEGDERPERLEKLTLLKWLFEAREQLHKEMFDLHAMRSDKYSEVILTPYRISKAQAKMDEATAFFKKDNWERQITFAKESLKRFEELQNMMEDNVSRGVEDQLSAFWDIAPGLLEVILQVPPDMSSFEIQIPLQEYDENPSYHEHPLQYLLSLLSHAEKSAYQFIESQTNLLCLLHEVRTATTKSRLRLVEIERNAASPDDVEIHAEMVQARREAENHLTHDLKDKVGEVERQWHEALGEGMKNVKLRVSVWLEESGGMEDGFES